MITISKPASRRGGPKVPGPKSIAKESNIWSRQVACILGGERKLIRRRRTDVGRRLTLARAKPCDLVKSRVSDIYLGDSVRLRSSVFQQKTGRPVPFELTDPTREALAGMVSKARFAIKRLAVSEP